MIQLTLPTAGLPTRVEVEVTSRVDRDRSDAKRFPRRARIYVSVPTELEVKLLGSPPESSVKGENDELDAAWRAYNRAEIALQRLVIDHVWDLFAGKAAVAFSRNAGCSCGCSPGFILKDDTFGRDFWLTVKAV